MSRREEFSVGARAGVDLDVRAGSVEVREGAPGVVVVTIGGDGGDDWEVSRIGDTISVGPGSRWRTRSGRIVVEAPPGTDVDVRSVSADVTVAGRLGATRLRSSSGDLRVGSVAHLDASTSSGDVRVEAVAADMTSTSVSGDITAGDVAGRLTATTASGDVRVAVVAGQLVIGTTSGDVRIGRFDGADLAVKSVSGDVEIGLPSGIRVEPDLSTLSGRTRLPPPAVPSPESSTTRRVVRIEVRTVSGSITISRAA